jgi:GlpG protein
MRLIGHLKTETSAKTFGAYLTSVDVPNLVEPEADGSWAVWVHNEDQIPEGQAALDQFQCNPADAKFQEAPKKAAALEQKLRVQEGIARKRTFSRDSIWPQMSLGPLTLVLIVVSVLVTLTGFMTPIWPDAMRWLAISEFTPAAMLPEVRHGQLWRLITPIFIHFGLLHLLFNMMMTRDLGSIIEIRQGTGKLALMVLALGIASNLGQFFLAGPAFGGMSGVLYGLFGYIWIRGRVDPASGLTISSSSALIMLAWYFLCLAGLIGSVANGTHTVGLLVGMAWGALPMLHPRRR